MDLSVVIASHNQPVGQYLTAFSAIQQLEDSGLDWEIVIAADGGEPTKWENQPRVRCLRINTGSPQGTRDAGIRAASGRVCLLLEDHVVVSSIESLYEAHKAHGGAITFASRRGEGTEMFHAYGSLTDWQGNLWIKRTLYAPKHPDRGYRVAQFGHSCFMLDRQAYLDAGGYTDLQEGWGGEEPLLCLKFWMLGRECWMAHPKIWHAHFLTAGAHADAYGSARMKRNFDIGKFVLTGERADDLTITPQIQAERDRICAGPYGGDINKLRKYFEQEGIVG